MEGWQDREAARRYLRTIDVLIPRRPEILATFSSLAVAFAPQALDFLDLGSGAGEVTAAILRVRPEAKATLVDFSDEMVSVSRDRFASYPPVRVLKHDLNRGLPVELLAGRYHLAVSCFALHHVDFENRVRLYSDIRSALAEGGLFVDADLFKGESATISEWEFDNWIAAMTAQIKEKLGIERTPAQVKATQLESFARLGDKPGTLWEMARDLRTSGFVSVDCVWKHQNLAMIVTSKQAAATAMRG